MRDAVHNLTYILAIYFYSMLFQELFKAMFNPFTNALRSPLLSLFNKWKKWGSENSWTFSQVNGLVNGWDNVNSDLPECRDHAFLLYGAQAWDQAEGEIISRQTWYCVTWIRWIPFNERGHGLLTWDEAEPEGEDSLASGMAQWEHRRALEIIMQADPQSRPQETHSFDTGCQTVFQKGLPTKQYSQGQD